MRSRDFIIKQQANDQWIRCARIMQRWRSHMLLTGLHSAPSMNFCVFALIRQWINTRKNHFANRPLRTRQCEPVKGRPFLQPVQHVGGGWYYSRCFTQHSHLTSPETPSTQNNRFFCLRLKLSDRNRIYHLEPGYLNEILNTREFNLFYHINYWRPMGR